MEDKVYDFTGYFDGACGPKNPGGNLGIGAYIINRENKEIFIHSEYIKACP